MKATDEEKSYLSICDPSLCNKLEHISIFYDPCKDCELNKT